MPALARDAGVVSASKPGRLYGVPGSEELHGDIGDAYEMQIEPWLDEHDHRPPRVIEEWSVAPPERQFRAAVDIVDWMLEDAADDSGPDYYDQTEHLTRDTVVLAAAEALIAALVSRITYRTADKRLAEHEITWDADDEPLLNGVRLYHRRTVATDSPDGAA